MQVLDFAGAGDGEGVVVGAMAAREGAAMVLFLQGFYISGVCGGDEEVGVDLQASFCGQAEEAGSFWSYVVGGHWQPLDLDMQGAITVELGYVVITLRIHFWILFRRNSRGDGAATAQ